MPTAASEPPQLLRPAAARTRRAHGALAARHKKRPRKTQPSALHRPASLARPAEHVDCARSHASQGRAPPGCVPSKESPRPEGQKAPNFAAPHPPPLNEPRTSHSLPTAVLAVLPHIRESRRASSSWHPSRPAPRQASHPSGPPIALPPRLHSQLQPPAPRKCRGAWSASVAYAACRASRLLTRPPAPCLCSRPLHPSPSIPPPPRSPSLPLGGPRAGAPPSLAQRPARSRCRSVPRRACGAASLVAQRHTPFEIPK